VCGPRQLSRYSDSLRYGRSTDRIPVGSRSSVAVQTGAGSDPGFCTRRIGSLPGVRRPARGVNHPSPSSAEVKDIVGVYLCPPPPAETLWQLVGRTCSLPVCQVVGCSEELLASQKGLCYSELEHQDAIQTSHTRHSRALHCVLTRKQTKSACPQ